MADHRPKPADLTVTLSSAQSERSTWWTPAVIKGAIRNHDAPVLDLDF